MTPPPRSILPLILLALALRIGAAPAVAGSARSWDTVAERTDFERSGPYTETLDYARRLDEASPWIHATTFGRSPEGRELILVVASKEAAFSPEAAVRTGKPVVLIQAGIHAGEINGKDAGLILLREIAVTRREAHLLDDAIVLFLPIYNVDGHERRSPYNRVNQDGPAETGWRTTARNLNLNRDYMKADAVETRAWLALFTSWWPDLTIDCHTTDGADFQYDMTHLFETGPNTPRGVADWMTSAVLEQATSELEAEGILVSRYIWFADRTDPSAGVSDFGVSRPMYAHGYTVLQNRPSIVLEAHALKDYGRRVRATFDTLRALLRAVNRSPEALREAVRAADRQASAPGREPLRFSSPSGERRVTIKGIAYRQKPSAVSGATRIVFGAEPIDLTVDWPVAVESTLAVDKPIAYIVPPQWSEIIEVLTMHGIRVRRLARETTVQVDMYRLVDPVWQGPSFEGRHRPEYRTERLAARGWTFPAGSAVVPMDQRASRVAVHLLEPEAPDSFAAWGFFDTIFEQKEFAAAYVLEEMALRMLAEDPALEREFGEALEDPEFAASPERRLDFFFQRSPYRDDRIGLYPVGRIITEQDLPLVH